MNEIRILSASGQLGYGIPIEALRHGVAAAPHLIGADMGSTDLGPFYLGSGRFAATQAGIKRDLGLVLEAGATAGVPVVIGSVGTAGARPHLDATLSLVQEVITERALRFSSIAVIPADIETQYAKDALAACRVKPCRHVPPLTLADLDATSHLVGQMGPEPIMEALAAGADLVIAGRACDTAIFAALPLLEGFDKGLAIHMAKIIECTSLCTEPGGRDAIMAHLSKDHFVLDPQNPSLRCTPTSVAAHALYEQDDPFVIVEPGGYVDVSCARYVAIDDRRVEVSGSSWVDLPYSIKLEGAGFVGHRCIALVGISDPILIDKLNLAFGHINELVPQLLPESLSTETFDLRFRAYGRNAVLGALEPNQDPPAEVGLMIEVIGSSSEIAEVVCSLARYNLLHYFYPGILATGGNLALPFTPTEVMAAPAYRFTVYHLLEGADPSALFPIEYRNS